MIALSHHDVPASGARRLSAAGKAYPPTATFEQVLMSNTAAPVNFRPDVRPARLPAKQIAKPIAVALPPRHDHRRARHISRETLDSHRHGLNPRKTPADETAVRLAPKCSLARGAQRERRVSSRLTFLCGSRNQIGRTMAAVGRTWASDRVGRPGSRWRFGLFSSSSWTELKSALPRVGPIRGIT